MIKRHLPDIKLSEEEREYLFSILHKGVHRARVITRARVLFNLDKGWSNHDVSVAVNVSVPTIIQIRDRFAEGGLEQALSERAGRGSKAKLSPKQAALITAIACSDAPDGHHHWTLRMLGNKIVELGFAQSYSHEAVRQLLKKTN